MDRRIRGENNSKVLLFLVCLSSFTKNPLSAILKGRSGGGKSHLVNRVLDVFRKMGTVIEYSRITGAYLENMANKNRPPKPQRQGKIDYTYEERLLEWKNAPRRIDLAAKILFIDELRGIQNAQAPKLLISEGRLRLGTVVNGEPVEIEVTGTPVIITTTTLAVLEDREFENRVIPVQIDESEEQTKQVLDYEAETYEDPTEDLTECGRTQALIETLRQLKPYDVANPYAKQIVKEYPTKNIEARRDFPKLMSLCDVVTWLNQHKRAKARKDLTIALITEPADIEVVKKLAEVPLRESLSGISPKEDEILKVFKESKTEEKASFGNTTSTSYDYMTIKDIYPQVRKRTRRGEQWVRDHVNRLVQEGYVEEHPDNIPGRKGLRYQYAELQPETLDIRTQEYAKRVLVQDWANTKGWKILGLGDDEGQAKTTPLERLQPEYSPNSKFAEHPLPASQFGVGQSGNEVKSQSKLSVDGDAALDRLITRRTSEAMHHDSYRHRALEERIEA